MLADADTLGAVLALAPEIDAYRGKGSQSLQREFANQLGATLYADWDASPSPPATDLFADGPEAPSPSASLPFWVEELSDHFFERVRGKPVHSRHAVGLRSMAWSTLGELSRLLRRPEHGSCALEIAADERRASPEREGAIQFLVDFWAEDDPDEATADLLASLRQKPPSRSFLVTVLQTQISLGLNDEWSALSALDRWDDAERDVEDE